MFTESIAYRDQSRSPREPKSSSTRRWSSAHTRVWLHSVKRRYTVDHDGPNPSGTCRQVHPEAATNKIAASTSLSP